MDTELQVRIVTSACGIHAWQHIAKNYPLYDEEGRPKNRIHGETFSTAFSPSNPLSDGNVADAEDEGLYIRHAGEYWRLEQDENGDIWAQNPEAEECNLCGEWYIKRCHCEAAENKRAGYSPMTNEEWRVG